MKKVFLLVLFLFSVKTIFCQSFNNSIKKTTLLIELFKNVHDLPGLSVSISFNDSLVYSKGFGYSNLENKTKVNPSTTKFRIASITKSITALTLGKLMELDSLDITKSVYFYLPKLQKKEYDFTIKQVGGHLSGIRRIPSKEKYSCDNNYNKDDFYATFAKDGLEFEPSTRYQYSNYGYKLLGLIIESKTGVTLTDSHKKYILEPLGLGNTIPDKKNSISTTEYYYKKNKKAPCLDCTFKFAEGCYLSTTEDIVKLGNGILYPNRILKKETLIELIKQQKTLNNKGTKYGFGFISLKDDFGNYFFGHSGNNSGNSSNYRIYPNSNLVISICINKGGIRTDKLISKIANQFIKKINR
jgi:CubicO group peptidase (beta-lactamase class C family)